MRASVEWIAALLEGSAPSSKRIEKLLTASGTEIEAVGKDAAGVFVEAAVTSNRPDLLCHRGLAREIAAMTGAMLKARREYTASRGPSSAIEVRVDDAQAAPRYSVHVVTGIQNGPSPEWLQQRLLAAGQRPINLVVDITNYILFEDGQPLHAFDLSKLSGSSLVVRRARAGERLEALNGKTLTLDATDLVIADAERPQALAGVMGGALSEVSAATTTIAIESARFAPRNVRASARRHQLRTESSHRFERGVEDAGVIAAGLRAAQMIAEFAGGTIAGDAVSLGAAVAAPQPIPFDPASVRRVAGTNCSRAKMRAFLERLGCQVEDHAGAWSVTPPSWRRDLTRSIDLVEEIVRLHGIDKVPERLAMPLAVSSETPLRRLRSELQDLLVVLGLHETITPDFVSEGANAEADLFLVGEGLRVAAPVRTGESCLRRSLLPSLLRVARLNQDLDNGIPRLFEVGAVNAKGRDGLPARKLLLGVLLPAEWRDARAVLDRILRVRNVSVEPVESANAALAPSARAEFHCKGQVVAAMGEPAAAMLEGLRTKPLYIEVDLGALDSSGHAGHRFEGLPRFPAMVRDLALKVRESVSFGAIATAVRTGASDQLEDLSLVEIFRGPQVGVGMKSLNIRLTFRSKTSTLTSAGIDAEMKQIVDALSSATAAEVRGA